MDDTALTKLLQDMEARINQRFDRMDESHAQLKNYVRDLRTETITRLELIESRLNRVDATLESIDIRLASHAKSAAEFSAFATKFAIEQANQRSRLTTLETQPAA